MGRSTRSWPRRPAPRRGPRGGLRKIGDARPEASLLEEFARAIDEPTARWYFHQRQARGAGSTIRLPGLLPALGGRMEAQARRRAHLRRDAAALDAHFEEREFGWTPLPAHLPARRGARAAGALLIDSGEIQATGFVYAGVPRPPGATASVTRKPRLKEAPPLHAPLAVVGAEHQGSDEAPGASVARTRASLPAGASGSRACGRPAPAGGSFRSCSSSP